MILALFRIVGGWTGLHRAFLSVGSWVMRKRLREMLAASETTHEALAELAYEWRSYEPLCVCLLRTRNGGGLPRLGAPLFSDLLDVVQSPGAHPMAPSDWSGVLLDDAQRRLIASVEIDGDARVDVSSLPPECTLRDSLESRGITSAMVLRIGCQTDAFLCVLVGFDRVPPLQSQTHPELRDATRRLLRLLRRLFSAS